MGGIAVSALKNGNAPSSFPSLYTLALYPVSRLVRFCTGEISENNVIPDSRLGSAIGGRRVKFLVRGAGGAWNSVFGSDSRGSTYWGLVVRGFEVGASGAIVFEVEVGRERAGDGWAGDAWERIGGLPPEDSF